MKEEEEDEGQKKRKKCMYRKDISEWGERNIKNIKKGKLFYISDILYIILTYLIYVRPNYIRIDR